MRINVRDLNDNASQFTRPNQTVVLRDSLPVNGEVTRCNGSGGERCRPRDRLVYRLQGAGDQQVLSVVEQSGELRSRVLLMESATFQLRSLVIDRKLLEIQLVLRVENVKADCLQNSVYIKLKS